MADSSQSATTALRAVAKPVVYLLARKFRDPTAPRVRTRTLLGCGIVNNDTVKNITENQKWALCAIIGHFDNHDQAEGFVSFWKSGASASRGPMKRASMGIAMAQLTGLQVWIDFNQLVTFNLNHYHVKLTDGEVQACALAPGAK